MKGLVLIGLTVAAASANAILVDDFMTGSYNSGAFTTGTSSAWTTAASAWGGIRYTALTITDNPLVGDAKTRVITTPGVLEVSTDSDVDTSMFLGYGYANTSTTAGSNALNLDLTGNSLIQVTFRSNDLAQPASVTVYTNGGATSFTRNLAIAGGISSVSPQTYVFDFSSDAASLGDVDGISFSFDPSAGGDFSLNSINAVPEPMSLAVLSIGAAALLRRKKK